MSKLQLKKSIKDLTADQLREVILEAYSASADVKQYFEYWLDPDPKVLIEKYDKLIEKHYFLSERKIRKKVSATEVNKLVKQFSALVQDPEWTARILQRRLIHETNNIAMRWNRKSLFTGYERRIREFIEYVEKNDLEAKYERSIETFKKALEELYPYY